MIISNSRRFIFVHVPKAAGTSVTMALDPELAWNDVVVGGTPLGRRIAPLYTRRFGLTKHSPAAEVRDVIGEDLWDAYFTFAFVRHPYSRVVSLYTFAKSGVGGRGKRSLRRLLPRLRRSNWVWPMSQAFLQTGSFSEFIRHEGLRRDIRARPQVDWVTDGDGRLMVDFVGKVETVDQDMETITGEIGLPGIKVGMVNRSGRGGWRKYLSDEADYEYLYELYRKDFDVLDYDPDIREDPVR